MTFIKIQVLALNYDTTEWELGPIALINTDKIVDIAPGTTEPNYIVDLGTTRYTISADEYQRLEVLLLGTPKASPAPESMPTLTKDVMLAWNAYARVANSDIPYPYEVRAAQSNFLSAFASFVDTSGVSQEPVKTVPVLPQDVIEAVRAFNAMPDEGSYLTMVARVNAAMRIIDRLNAHIGGDK